MSKQKWILVCDNCLQASCWLGEFMCEDARSAGIYRVRREDLEALALESPHHWDKAVCTYLRCGPVIPRAVYQKWLQASRALAGLEALNSLRVKG